jgi:hypothetical protein
MDRKELLRQYRATPRPMGVFAVRNTVDGKALVGSSPNLPGMLNRQRFDLENGSHRLRDLQADWDRLGPDAFTFEVLDELEPPDDPGFDPSDDLAALADLWLDKLALPAARLYGRH